jgi:hypothetical protein
VIVGAILAAALIGVAPRFVGAAAFLMGLGALVACVIAPIRHEAAMVPLLLLVLVASILLQRGAVLRVKAE